MSRKVVLYIASSLDGYIAKQNDDISFLSLVEKDGEDYGYSDFMETVDTIILGRRTYDKIVSMGIEYPNSDKVVYVITRTEKPSNGKVNFFSDEIKSLITKLKSESGKNIFCDGGSQIVNELLKANLIDEIILSVIPILLGDGISLFNDERPEKRLELISSQQYEKGLVQLHYKVINE